MVWECIDSFHVRTKVFGGWLVKAYIVSHDGSDYSLAMTFVPDPNHEWDLGKNM